MEAFELAAASLGPASEIQSGDSTRSSFSATDDWHRRCCVYVYDDIGTVTPARFDFQGNSALSLDALASRDRETLEALCRVLESRDISRTRWVNIVGTSRSVLREVEKRCLCDSALLTIGESGDSTEQAFGGPVQLDHGEELIWIDTPVWFLGSDEKRWSSLKQAQMRLVVRLHTDKKAGILVTTFAGPRSSVQELSRLVTDRLLYSHPLRASALCCTWILTFSVMRTMAEEVAFVLALFDVTDASSETPQLPRLEDVSRLLAMGNRLAVIARYLSSLQELIEFLIAVRRTTDWIYDEQGEATYRSRRTKAHAGLEQTKAEDKARYSYQHCTLYADHARELVQMVLLHQSAMMNMKLDRNQGTTELITKLGLIVAGIAGVATPLSVLTSYYGMNVKEFVPGAQLSLFDFWTLGIPILLMTTVPLAFVALWTLTKPNDQAICK